MDGRQDGRAAHQCRLRKRRVGHAWNTEPESWAARVRRTGVESMAGCEACQQCGAAVAADDEAVVGDGVAGVDGAADMACDGA